MGFNGPKEGEGEFVTKPITERQAKQICGMVQELKKVDRRGLTICNLAVLRKNGDGRYELVGSEPQIIDVERRLRDGEESFLRHQRLEGEEVGKNHYNPYNKKNSTRSR